jgi:MurNAc alpha-1-phosphate uridylyltransferase
MCWSKENRKRVTRFEGALYAAKVKVIMKAMILAAGRGERMRPLTDHTPKPLLQAGGKPLIVWHIENLVHAGITEIIINHAHLGALIEAELGDGSRFNAQLFYSPEDTALETAGGIAFALPLLGDDPFAVINGDIYCDYDFTRLVTRAAALQTHGDTAHLVLINNPEHHPNGDFYLHHGRLVPFFPPAASHEAEMGGAAKLTFSGIGLYQPSLFAQITRGNKAPLAPLLHQQIALGKVGGEHFSGNWVDVGTPQRLKQLDNDLRSSQNGNHV